MVKPVPRTDKIASQIVGRIGKLADGEARHMPKQEALSPARQLQDYYDGVHIGKVESGEIDDKEWDRYTKAMRKLEREMINRERGVR